MKKNIFLFICLCGLFSCNSHSADNSSATKQLSDMVEGKDYLTLKRFRVVDNQGFSQPVEVSSFLLPANWQVNSNIKWDATRKCIPEMLEANLVATSPDKDFEILMFPATQFDWSDDPIYLDAMQKGFNMHSCTIAQPLDATGFIAQSIAQQMNAQVKSARIIPEIQKLMDEGANNMTQMARQAGNNAYSHQGSAAEGILQFADGKEGIALCTVMQTITTMTNAQGYGMINNYQSHVSMRIVMKYKTGSEAMARKIFGTFLSSSRMNPQWTRAIQEIFANIGRNAQIQLGQQIEIARQAQEEISNNIIRNWESSNTTKNTNEVSPDQFGQYIRGVDSWSDENGNKIELSSGYSNAWSKGDGTYILSDNPAFDPNVTFNESWNRLSK